ncbi:MAG: DUF2933 domain-containing protein, partial [Anaerolineae bacterium]|nr:DUF2933 domain-containing protein [Anaerolineae bacterium]NIQ81026.1 DUF2933 domain-containing protein [Anaerolineae bacterium]
AWAMNLLLFLAVALLLLVAERGVRVLGFWPVLFLLGCAGMHFFMHGSHGGHRHGGQEGHHRSGRHDAGS